MCIITYWFPLRHIFGFFSYQVWKCHITLIIHLIFLHSLICLFLAGSQGVLFVFLNCFVHAVMYTYYLISIYKPMGFKPSITIKKNITRLQMVSFFRFYFNSMNFSARTISFAFAFNFLQAQFCLLFIHLMQVVVIPGCDCGYPKILPFLASTQCVLMFVLFDNFYRRAYGPKLEHRKIQ